MVEMDGDGREMKLYVFKISGYTNDGEDIFYREEYDYKKYKTSLVLENQKYCDEHGLTLTIYSFDLDLSKEHEIYCNGKKHS